MAPRIHVIPRASLAENSVLVFDLAGDRYLVADVEGDVQAYAVTGPSARRVGGAAVTDGHVLCPLHGWAIDPAGGGCGAADRCTYWPVPVEVDADSIKVIVSPP
jgi:nitrite reductase/ring-hydroxylating ferredoxin subunit